VQPCGVRRAATAIVGREWEAGVVKLLYTIRVRLWSTSGESLGRGKTIG
jgi:hypothetical protein